MYLQDRNEWIGSYANQCRTTTWQLNLDNIMLTTTEYCDTVIMLIKLRLSMRPNVAESEADNTQACFIKYQACPSAP